MQYIAQNIVVFYRGHTFTSSICSSFDTQTLTGRSVAEEKSCGKLVAYERITSRLLIGRDRR